MAYANGYTYRRSLVVDHTKVSGTGDLTDFPMLVSGTYAYLATVANGGKVTNASGYDIIFTSDAAGNTPLDHEIHGYVATTGEFRAFVRIPTLDGDAATTIYMFYGNSSISTSQEDKPGVWKTAYKGVWHLQEAGNGTADEFKDSTSNANHGQGGYGNSNVPDRITGGKFGFQQEFDGDNTEGIGVPDDATLDLAESITINMYVRTPGSSNFQGLISKRQDGGNINYHTFLWTTNENISFQGNNYQEGSVALSNTMTKLTFIVWNGIETRVRINGVSTNTFSGRYLGGTNDQPLTFGFFFNTSNNPIEVFYGGMQEVRIQTGNVSDDWDTTEYNNENDPSTFYSVGDEEIADIIYISTLSGQADAVSSITQAVTVAAGQQLIVKSSAEDNADVSHLPITSIVFNGAENFTKRVSQEDVSAENDRTEIWDLLNPTATTANVVITYTNTVDGLVWAIEKYINIGSFDVSTSDAVNDTAGPVEDSLTTTAAECLIVDAAQTLSSSRTLTPASGQTATYNIQNAGQLRAAGGYEIVGAAGSYTQSWTLDANADWIICIAAYKPVIIAAQIPNKIVRINQTMKRASHF